VSRDVFTDQIVKAETDSSAVIAEILKIAERVS
jgi:hypothetical protein